MDLKISLTYENISHFFDDEIGSIRDKVQLRWQRVVICQTLYLYHMYLLFYVMYTIEYRSEYSLGDIFM